MKSLFYSLTLAIALMCAPFGATAAAPTSGQFLFQRKPVSGTGPFEAFGVTPLTGQTFGWDGSQVVMFGPGGGITWGSITGTLSAQTDLQTALNAKLASAGVLPLAGFSSITGTLPAANLPGTAQLTTGTLALGGFGSITGTIGTGNLPATIPSGNLPATVQYTTGTLALGGFGSITGTLADARLSANVQLANGTLALGGFGSITGQLPAANIANLAGTYLTVAAAAAGYQPLDADLTAISALAGTNNIYYRSGAGAWSSVTIGSGLSFSAGSLAATNAGTVTSVAMSVPSVFSVAGSPITSSGTFALSLATQSANLVWAGPTTGSAATPTFRSLVAADIPSLSATYLTPAAAAAAYQPLDGDLSAIAALTGTNSLYYRSAANTWTPVAFGSGLGFSGGTLSSSVTGTVTSVGLTAPAIFSVGGSPIISSGSLALSLATQSANLVWAGPTTGSAAAPAFRALVANDIPDISATYLTPAAAAAAYQPLDADLTALAALAGTNNIYYRSAANTWSSVTIGSGLSFSAGSLAATSSASVSSVGLSLPAVFSVSGSPVTTTGTLTATLANQSANLVWAGPTSGSAAAPTFRGLVALDIPDISASYLTPAAAASAYQPLDADLTTLAGLTGTNNLYYRSGAGAWSSVTVGSGLSFGAGTLASSAVSSVGLSLPAVFSVSGSPVTSSGTLTATLATQSANAFWGGPTTGSAAAPTFRTLVSNDIPDLSASYVSTSANLASLAFVDLGYLSDATGAKMLSLDSNTTAVNYWQIANSATGQPISFSALGSDSNISATIAAKGTGRINFASNLGVTSTGIIVDNTNAANLLEFSGTASTPTNWLKLSNSTAGVGPTLEAAGGDTNIALTIKGKGTGAVTFTGNAKFSSGIVDSTASTGALGAVPVANGAGGWAWAAGAGTGTVTSVDVALPASVFSVSGGPITTGGTITGSFATQSANTVFAGAVSGAAATPAFRSLVAADLPNTSVTPGSYTNSSITVDAQGRITSAATSTSATTVANTFTGAQNISTAGVVSTPPLRLTGAWFTGGGSSTTTKPQFLIEQATATTTGWSTSGTGLGVNSVSGFAGNLVDIQKNAVSQFAITASGNITSTGVFANAGNSGASISQVLSTGTWFSGGSATTTKPAILLEPTGTTSTAWNTLGTGLGLNSASGFTGNLVDLQKSAVSQFSVDASGNVNAATGDISTSTIGKTLKVKSGTNAKSGTFTLVAGAVVHGNTSVTANSVICITLKTLGGTQGNWLKVVPTALTGFAVTSENVADISTYNYVILEVN